MIKFKDSHITSSSMTSRGGGGGGGRELAEGKCRRIHDSGDSVLLFLVVVYTAVSGKVVQRKQKP